MIWDSQYWRDDLHRRAVVLRDKQRQRRWGQASFGRLEQTVMLGFYAIRKLAEARKIPDAKFSQPVHLHTFSAKGKVVTLLNWHKLDELYDVNDPRETREALSFVCNQIIHSYVFTPIFRKGGGLESIAFNSDRTRSSRLYSIAVDEMIRLFTSISGSYVGKATYFRVSEDGDLTVMTEEEVANTASQPIAAKRGSG